ncbi:hypothetical protein HU200_041204 [Digitaria exilis]|uniref:BOP1 N-terminal domain-containing protein n=1 Tax=Digitaria exilis TaxID=1010633 RepID=A0A835EEA0_9POAL|nr:hypothetical protein HU200_041204 [Digitaria exilis]
MWSGPSSPKGSQWLGPSNNPSAGSAASTSAAHLYHAAAARQHARLSGAENGPQREGARGWGDDLSHDDSSWRDGVWSEDDDEVGELLTLWLQVAPRNTVGDVPLEWYKDEEHIGYDIDGRKIKKCDREGRIEAYLKNAMMPRIGSPNLGDYVDWFEYEDKGHPLSSAPEPKRQFVPSKWEQKKIYPAFHLSLVLYGIILYDHNASMNVFTADFSP